MGNLKEIVGIKSDADFQTLVDNGSLTYTDSEGNEQVIEYNDDSLYFTPEQDLPDYIKNITEEQISKWDYAYNNIDLVQETARDAYVLAEENETKIKSMDLAFDTSIRTTGTYNFLVDISNYKMLSICAYDTDNNEYIVQSIPVSEFLLKDSSYPLNLDRSSSATTRYMLMYPLFNDGVASTTSFVVSNFTKMNLRRIWAYN